MKCHQAGAEPIAGGVRNGVLEIGDNPAEGHLNGCAAAGFQFEGEFAGGIAMEDEVTDIDGEILPRHPGVKRNLFGELPENCVAPDDHGLAAQTPRLNSAIAERKGRVGDDQIGVKAAGLTRAPTGRAGSLGSGVVEESSRWFRVNGGTFGTGKIQTKGDVPEFAVAGFLIHYDGAAFALAEGHLEGIGDPAALIGAEDDPVDDDLKFEGFFLTGDQFGVIDLAQLSSDPDAGPSFEAEPFDLLAEDGGRCLDEGREENQAGAGGNRKNTVDAVIDCLAANGGTVEGAKGLASAGPENAGVVGDLGYGCDGGAGITTGRGLLGDCDDRGEALDIVNIGSG